jgi:hypothetical protein
MGTQQRFLRRHVLAISAAAGSLAIRGDYAVAQGAKRIERLDSALDQIIDTSEPIVDIAANLGGTVLYVTARHDAISAPSVWRRTARFCARPTTFLPT